MERAGCLRKCEDWFENGRWTLPIVVECWHESDCCWVEVYLATLTCWGYYQILNIGVCIFPATEVDQIYFNLVAI